MEDKFLLEARPGDAQRRIAKGTSRQYERSGATAAENLEILRPKMCILYALCFLFTASVTLSACNMPNSKNYPQS